MRKVNMHQAKSTLSELVRAVEGGEEIVLARDGRPVARLVPYGRPARGRRPIGLHDGTLVDEDAFVAASLERLTLEELEAWRLPVEPTRDA